MSLSKYMKEYMTMSGSEDGEICSSSDESDEPEITHVTPPLKLPKMMFTAHLSTSLTSVTPYRIVVYDVIDMNYENVYNVCTGRFKATESGLYVFFATLSAKKDLDTKNESVCLIHNFHPADKSRQGTALFEKGPFKTKTLRSLITLKKGDEMWVMRLCKSEKNENKNKIYHSTFSGGLLEKQTD